MTTDALIKALSADAARPSLAQDRALALALALASLTAATVFALTLGLRPDFAAAARSPRFLFKFVIAALLAASAFRLAGRMSRPGAALRRAGIALFAAPLLLAMAVLAELALLPEAQWMARLVGSNSLLCLACIPLIGLGPLALFLLALRHGAPTRPAAAGAAAGLAAGGLAAFFYAAHCPDDSPLFVATWYTLAVAMLTLLGALLAPRIIRW